ncbi:hypothetical protein CHUV0807_1091 [Cardiobacterium hominis]|uniref:Uncharacterized protein n=1 Tax=Cardiobacterium hominis TaxID=2718 RepID=A0A1C3H3W3_9GAMM|nr:hypothetical protein CHUV0807_1091 [Cardiobacterium hominis]
MGYLLPKIIHIYYLVMSETIKYYIGTIGSKILPFQRPL